MAGIGPGASVFGGLRARLLLPSWLVIGIFMVLPVLLMLV
jgi:spermidine/putrescine transport system permease protein